MIVLGTTIDFVPILVLLVYFVQYQNNQSLPLRPAWRTYLALIVQVRLDDRIKPYNFMFSSTQGIDLSFMIG